jgi:hypothetical protein
LFLLCLVAVLIAVAANHEARKAFWLPTRPVESDTGWGPAMRASRLLLVYALGALIIGGSLISWIRDREYWPFSPYPMFSELVPGTDFRFSALKLYGVTQEQPQWEVPLDRNEYLEPFDNSRLNVALDIAVRQKRVAAVLKDCLERYEALRIAGIHQGPAIQGIRVYHVTWNMNTSASNVSRPDQRELLGEFSEPLSKGQ